MNHNNTECSYLTGDIRDPSITKINLGCGGNIFPGFLNVDKFNSKGCGFSIQTKEKFKNKLISGKNKKRENAKIFTFLEITRTMKYQLLNVITIIFNFRNNIIEIRIYLL